MTYTLKNTNQRGANAARRSDVFCIEGENVTMAEMAARVGVSRRTLKTRYDTARRKPDAITWESLRR